MMIVLRKMTCINSRDACTVFMVRIGIFMVDGPEIMNWKDILIFIGLILVEESYFFDEV